MATNDIKDRAIPQLASVTPITGSTTINHSARVAMELSMDEYAVVDMIERYSEASKPFCDTEVYRTLGMNREEVQAVITQLWAKGFIEISKGVSKFRPTTRWKEGFMPTKNEFEQFWEPMDIVTTAGKKHIAWTGAKPDAEKKFLKARKLESFEYLMAQKVGYFRMIASSDYRKVMGCSVFLNVDTKRYSEDWAKSTDGKVVQVKEKKPEKTLTKENVREAF